MRGAALRLLGERRGSSLVEFALALPVILTLIMGLGELAYTAYVRTMLTGAMQKAARDAGIQGGATQTAALDASVMKMVRLVARRATYVSSRKSYAQYGYIGTAEPFTDSTKNGVKDGICNNGEPFTDYNGNGKWDKEPGLDGQGGASDVTVYSIVLTYPRLFPVGRIVGMTGQGQLTSTVILKNQPYGSQAKTPTGTCP